MTWNDHLLKLVQTGQYRKQSELVDYCTKLVQPCTRAVFKEMLEFCLEHQFVKERLLYIHCFATLSRA